SSTRVACPAAARTDPASRPVTGTALTAAAGTAASRAGQPGSAENTCTAVAHWTGNGATFRTEIFKQSLSYRGSVAHHPHDTPYPARFASLSPHGHPGPREHPRHTRPARPIPA